MSDTIYALSSAPGRAGVAVIRVSGPAARDLTRRLAGAEPKPRRAALRTLRGADDTVLDQALVLWLPGPGSFTGEDTAEFHVHGGRAIIEVVFAQLAQFPGVRPAEPGEFTRRAVQNGRLDLTQAEAVMDLVDADTQLQRRQALRQYDGALGRLYDGWRERLIVALAWVEAQIDFSEDELPSQLDSRSREEITVIIKQIQGHMNDARRGELMREGIHLAVIGPPNAGKSSLINALAKRDVAIVHETAGTTRDVIEVVIDIAGIRVIVADTAGLRDAVDAVEREGIRRALTRAEEADATILLVDASVDNPFEGLPAQARAKAALVVWNKVDLRDGPTSDGRLLVSLKTGAGFDWLIAEIGKLVSAKVAQAGEAPVITRARHRRALEEAVAALQRAAAERELELAAEDLRLAVRAFGRITGRVDVEDLLDVVFRDFCIGK